VKTENEELFKFTDTTSHKYNKQLGLESSCLYRASTVSKDFLFSTMMHTITKSQEYENN
jgi:hypothetical protein